MEQIFDVLFMNWALVKWKNKTLTRLKIDVQRTTRWLVKALSWEGKMKSYFIKDWSSGVFGLGDQTAGFLGTKTVQYSGGWLWWEGLVGSRHFLCWWGHWLLPTAWGSPERAPSSITSLGTMPEWRRTQDQSPKQAEAVYRVLCTLSTCVLLTKGLHDFQREERERFAISFISDQKKPPHQAMPTRFWKILQRTGKKCLFKNHLSFYHREVVIYNISYCVLYWAFLA